MFKLVALSGLGLLSAQSVDELCDALIANCGWGSWSNKSSCLTMFPGVTPGSLADTVGDTLGCRQNYATKANASDPTTQHNCAFAGPVGGGLCGVPKTGACRAILSLCGTAQHANQTDCESNLTPIQFFTGTNQGGNASGENSLECRVYHAQVGAGADPQNHCSAHTSVGGPCAANVTTNAWHHCAQLQGACSATADKQYPDEVSCRNVFAVFPDSPVLATDGNDRGSRQYHGVAAYASGDKAHCQHAGPTGGGRLGGAGGSYEAWRRIVGMPVCTTGMGAMFAGVSTNVASAFQYWNMSDLMTVVPPATGLNAYSTSSHTSGNTEACRIYHLTVAAQGGQANLIHCAHGDVSGGNFCGDVLANGCLIINTGCGNKAYNGSSSACYSALLALGAQNKTGNMSEPMPNDDSIYCRVYNGGRALVAKNVMNNNDRDAACNRVMMMGGCGGAATNAPTMAKNGASALVASSLLAFLPLFA